MRSASTDPFASILAEPVAAAAIGAASVTASAAAAATAPVRVGAERPTASPSSPSPTPPPAARPVKDEEGWWERWRLVVFAAACWAFLLAAVVLGRAGGPEPVVTALFVAAYLAGGTVAAWAALRDLVVHRTVNVDLLMVTAAIGAAFVGAWAEGAVLLGLFSSSGALEQFALGKTRRAVRALMELSPAVAAVERDGGEVVLPVEQVRPGDVVVVRPGERVAVDGVVLSGTTAIDQAAITGESLPVAKAPGDGVFAGTINGFGAVRVRVDRLHAESTLAKIVRFVEEAQEQKSRTQRFTDAFEGRYAVGVILAAAALALVPPLGFGADWGASFYRAMTLLVVASPCALVISTPASTLSALANAARQGILFKGGNHLEDAGAIRTVAFDKTGTLTVGHPALTDVVVLDPAWSEPEALRLAAAAERFSEHHLAAAVVRGAEARGLEIPAASGFRALAGKGVVASVAGRQIVVGNDMLFAELGAPVSDRARAEADRLRREGKTAVFVGAGGGPGDGLDGLGNGRGSLGGALGSPGAAGDALGAMRDGVPSSPGGMGDGAPGSDPGRGPGANGDALAVRALVAVADTLRPAAAGAVADLKRLGVERIVMLTGDNAIVARAIGDALGIADVRADLLPEEKLAIVAELKREGPVAMVGDGVNDAPALATASLGVAMGGAGTDVALETADVVLMGDDLSRLPYAIELGRKTRRVIVQNLGFALAVIAVLVASTLTVGIPLPLGVVGHEGSTVLVVLNGLRLLRPLGRVAGPPLPRS